MNTPKVLFAIVGSFFTSFPFLANAVDVQLLPSKDNTIYEEGDLSNALGDYLFAGKTRSSDTVDSFYRRALLQFDLTSQIPAGSTIDAVILSLNVSRIPPGEGSTERPFGLHKMKEAWGEGTSNAPDAEGRGDDATTGDATWNHAFYPDQPWTSAENYFEFAPSASTKLTSTGPYEWSGPKMIEDVQEWLDQPETNFGWILLGPANDGTARRFDSRENPTEANWPVLTISYTPAVADWGGYPVEPDGRTVDTGDYLGYIDIDNRPWIYVYSLASWIYLPEDQISQDGAWGYLPR